MVTVGRVAIVAVVVGLNFAGYVSGFAHIWLWAARIALAVKSLALIYSRREIAKPVYQKSLNKIQPGTSHIVMSDTQRLVLQSMFISRNDARHASAIPPATEP